MWPFQEAVSCQERGLMHDKKPQNINFPICLDKKQASPIILALYQIGNGQPGDLFAVGIEICRSLRCADVRMGNCFFSRSMLAAANWCILLTQSASMANFMPVEGGPRWFPALMIRHYDAFQNKFHWEHSSVCLLSLCGILQEILGHSCRVMSWLACIPDRIMLEW